MCGISIPREKRSGLTKESIEAGMSYILEDGNSGFCVPYEEFWAALQTRPPAAAQPAEGFVLRRRDGPEKEAKALPRGRMENLYALAFGCARSGVFDSYRA